MALSTPGAMRLAPGAMLLLLFLLAPGVAAQAPEAPSDPERSAISFSISCTKSFLLVPYNGAAEGECIVTDHTRDSGAMPGSPVGGVAIMPHSVQLSVNTTRPFEYNGWQLIIGQPFIPIIGGQSVRVPIILQTTPAIDTADIEFDVLAVYKGPNGYTLNQTVTITGKVASYDIAYATLVNPARKAGQDEVVTWPIQVTNFGVYPETYEITVRASSKDLPVSHPSRIYVLPGETREVTMSILTPNDKIYQLQRNEQLTVTVKSTSTGAVYAAGTAIVNIRGAYLPVYWVPLILVGMVSAAIVARETRENRELRRLEGGRPRRLEPTPRQAVLLAELKRRDPEAYKKKKAQLDALYATRREQYRGERKERQARDREEHKQAKREMKEEKKRLALAKKEAKKQAKADKKAAKKQAKLDKKAAKKQARIDKKEAKVLAKKRAKLEKQKAKLEKKAAKASAKEAKAQARAQKAAAKAAKREARRRE